MISDRLTNYKKANNSPQKVSLDEEGRSAEEKASYSVQVSQSIKQEGNKTKLCYFPQWMVSFFFFFRWWFCIPVILVDPSDINI